MQTSKEPNHSVYLPLHDPRTVDLPALRCGLRDTSWYRSAQDIEKKAMYLSLKQHFKPGETKPFKEALTVMVDSFGAAIQAGSPHPAYRHQAVVINVAYTLLCESLRSAELNIR